MLVMVRKHRHFAGQVFLWYLILHSTLSLFLEKYRGDDRAMVLDGRMSVTQGIATLMLTLSVIALLVLKSRGKASGNG